MTSFDMADHAAMAVYGGDVADAVVGHVAHADPVGAAGADRSTDPAFLRQSRPYDKMYSHPVPGEVVDGVPVITDKDLYDACIRNRACAHTRRVHARYESLPGFIDVMSETWSPDHAGDRVAGVHGSPYFGRQGPQRRAYTVMSVCNEVVRDEVPLHRFHRLVYTNAVLFPVKGTETVEAAANSFCRLLRNWPKAVFLPRFLATDLAVPFGHDSGLEECLNQLELVGNDENDVVDVDLSSRMSEFPNPFWLPLFPAEHHRAADTRFFRNRGLLPTAWAAGFIRAPRILALSRWLPPIPDWEPFTELWVETPLVVSYPEDSLRNEYC